MECKMTLQMKPNTVFPLIILPFWEMQHYIDHKRRSKPKLFRVQIRKKKGKETQLNLVHTNTKLSIPFFLCFYPNMLHELSFIYNSIFQVLINSIQPLVYQSSFSFLPISSSFKFIYFFMFAI